MKPEQRRKEIVHIMLSEQKAISGGQLAEKLGVHQTLISQWCCGKCLPNIHMIKKLAQALHTDYTVIIEALGDAEEKEGGNYAKSH